MDGSTSAWTESDYSKESIKLCVNKIKDEFGQQFSNSKSILEQHTHTMTIHESELPDGVVFVETKEDVKKVHAWLASYADEHYGKKFLVRLPFVCYYYEPDSGQTLYSDLPTSDGGYPAPGAYDILSLTWPGTGIDFFSDDKGKIQCFGRFIGNLPIVSGSGVGE